MIKQRFDRLWSRFALSGNRNSNTPGTIKKWVLGVIFVLVMSPLLGTVYTYTRAGESARVHAATASTLNFQARLMGSSGALVSDGSYSIQFKLYDAVTGGTNEWTETQTVTVKNGYFSSYLGAVTPFAGTIDWSQEKWLTMNVNGDGEMTPRIKLTAVPYALRSGQADNLTITGGTITGDNLLQKAPGTIQNLSSSNAGLRFNQTGAGGLVQLQGDGVTVFTVDKTGNAALSGGLTLGGSTSTTAGTLRWNGSDFEGYNGTSWVSLTATGGTTAFTQGGNTLGEDAVLGTTDNYALRFITNNTEKFTILANGNVGVGDTTPSALFTVGTADALTITASGNLTTVGTITSTGLVTANGGLNINLGGTPGLLKVDASGNVGLATSGSDYEQPLSFANGLTRTGNSVVLGGALTGNTTIDMASFNLTFNNGGTLNIGATTTPFASKLNIGGNLVTTSSSYNVFSANSNLNAYGYFRAVDTSDTVGRFELGAYDVNGASQGGRDLVLNPLGGNVGIGGDLTPDGLFSVGSSSQFQVNGSGTITAATSGNTINGLVINSGALSGVTTLNMSGGITAATTNTINSLNINAGNVSGLTGMTFISGGINLNNGGITNAGALSGITTLQAASGKFNVDANGGLTSGFTQLDGSTTTTSASGLTPGTVNVGSGNTANFDVGNYVLINGTYAKITAKTASALSITPNLTWSTGAAVTEYYIPEIGGSNTSSPLTSRFGRGYFIAGVATGNGTTYYNEDGITTTLGTFNIANENASVLNIGGAATNITLGTSSTTVNVAGNLQTAANQTITAGGGLTVSSGGINNNNGGIIGAGALSGVTTISASGSITAATSNTINGLSINAGALSGVTGITFTSGGINLNNGGITNAGAISGITTISASGAITAATATNTINGLIINAGSLSGITGYSQTSGAFSVTGTGNITLGAGSNALTINSSAFDVTSAGAVSGVTTLGLSGAITGATAGNTINGLIINSGALSGISTISASGGITAATTGTINGLNINAGALSGVTTISASGAITAATATNTINGLIINAGSLSGITGFSQTSGAFSVTGTGAITLGGGSNALTINSTAFDVTSTGAISGVTTIALSGAITGATATNTINGLIINSGSLSGITGYSQTSGNFAMSGTGTFSTGTGAVALNGAVTAAGVLNVGGNVTITNVNADYRIVRGTTTYTGLDVNCGNNQYMNSINVRGGIVTGYSACSGVGLSDQRLKTNIVGLEGSVLDSLKNIQTVTFDFDCSNNYFSSTNTSCDTKNQTGVLAQQLETVLPGLVYSDEYGYKHVNYEGLSIYTLRGVSELSKYLNSQGNANLNTISTGGTLRLTASGALQNITGLTLSSGGASIVGGLNNNNSGITAVGSITGATTIGAQSLTLDAAGGQNLLTLKKDGNGVFTVFNDGALELKLDSSHAFTVKGANGDNALNIDTLTGKVKIGAGNNGKTVLFVLDTKSSDGDPAGVNGAQYYNSAMKKFRCYQNDKWQDCLQTAFSEYTIASGGAPWIQPAGDHELPGENRTWIDLGNANQARLLINVTLAGNQGASCKLQYSLTEDNPIWHDLTDSGTTVIDRTGAVKGEWLQVKNEAKGEVLVRVYCSGGNNTAIMNYSSIRTQIR